MDKVTTDTILSYLQDQVENKKVMNADIWQDAAFKLNLLLGDEHEKLEDLRTAIANMKLELMKDQAKLNVSAVQVQVEASQEWKAMRLQEHKVNRIEEFIRLAKIQAKTAAGM